LLLENEIVQVVAVKPWETPLKSLNGFTYDAILTKGTVGLLSHLLVMLNILKTIFSQSFLNSCSPFLLNALLFDGDDIVDVFSRLQNNNIITHYCYVLSFFREIVQLSRAPSMLCFTK
jgi:hypothetical protein